MFSYLPIPSGETRPQRALAWQPAEWGQAVQRAQWYRLSSFSYCAVGLLTLLRPEPFQACAPFFPTRTMGASIFVNGLFSYMGDVATWGWHSFWKTADVILATINTLVQVFAKHYDDHRENVRKLPITSDTRVQEDEHTHCLPNCVVGDHRCARCNGRCELPARRCGLQARLQEAS